jgi:hypothetical protein
MKARLIGNGRYSRLRPETVQNPLQFRRFLTPSWPA